MGCASKIRGSIRALVFLLGMVLAAGPALLSGSAVAGESKAGRTKEDRVYFLEEEARFQGMYSDSTFPLFIPHAWEIGSGAQLVLSLHHSALLNDSNLTVALNQVKVTTVALRESTSSGPMVINVPSRAIVPGWNVMRLRFYLRASDDPCKDVDNPGLWAAIGADTYLRVPHDIRVALPDLSRFPDSYIEPWRGGAGIGRPRVSILLPQDFSREALNNAAFIAASMGHTGHFARGAIRGLEVVGQRPQGLEDTHLIFVGTVAGLESIGEWIANPAELLERLTEALKPYPEVAHYGALLETPSPLNNKRRFLLAVGSDANGLEILRDNLAHPLVRRRVSGDFQLFLSSPSEREDEPEDPDRVSLEALRLGDVALRGVTTRMVRFKVPVPRHWKLSEKAHLELFIRHSVSLSRRATFEVDINGVPVYSRELVPDLGADEVRSQDVSIPIPASLRDGRNLEVQFRLFVDVGSDDCARPYDDSIWVVVGKESYVALTHEETDELDLSQYPDLFASQGGGGRVGLLLDRESGPEGLTAMLATASSLGARAQFASLLDLVATDLEHFGQRSSKDKGAQSWIVLNQGEMAPELQPLLSTMPLPTDEHGRLEQASRIAYSVPDWASDGVVFEVFRSPWQENRVVLLVNGPGNTSLEHAGEVLGHAWGLEAFSGNVALIAGGRPVLGYHVPVKRLEPATATLETNNGMNWKWLIVLLSSIGIGLGLWLLLRPRDAQKRTR